MEGLDRSNQSADKTHRLFQTKVGLDYFVVLGINPGCSRGLVHEPVLQPFNGEVGLWLERKNQGVTAIEQLSPQQLKREARDRLLININQTFLRRRLLYPLGLWLTRFHSCLV